MAKIKEAFMRKILTQYSAGNISFGKMVELLNDEAKREKQVTCNHENSVFDFVEQKFFCDNCGYLRPKTGSEIIAEERARQINVEGWTPEHDDKHTDGQLAAAACVYADFANYHGEFPLMEDGTKKAKVLIGRDFKWPFSKEWLKLTPEDRVKELGKAGGFVAAEIDRVNRLKAKDLEFKYMVPIS